jgi:hypothetical protein
MGFHVAGIEPTGDLLDRQETVAFGTIIHENGIKARLDAADPGLVDIAFLLLPANGLYVEVVKGISVNDGNSDFLALNGIDQDSFHALVSFGRKEGQPFSRRPPAIQPVLERRAATGRRWCGELVLLRKALSKDRMPPCHARRQAVVSWKIGAGLQAIAVVG